MWKQQQSILNSYMLSKIMINYQKFPKIEKISPKLLEIINN